MNGLAAVTSPGVSVPTDRNTGALQRKGQDLASTSCGPIHNQYDWLAPVRFTTRFSWRGPSSVSSGERPTKNSAQSGDAPPIPPRRSSTSASQFLRLTDKGLHQYPPVPVPGQSPGFEVGDQLRVPLKHPRAIARRICELIPRGNNSQHNIGMQYGSRISRLKPTDATRASRSQKMRQVRKGDHLRRLTHHLPREPRAQPALPEQLLTQNIGGLSGSRQRQSRDN